MKITLDSNVYRKVASPDIFVKDPRHSAFVVIHNAVVAGCATGYISETVLTLEGIQNSQRPEYFAASELDVKFTETPNEHRAIDLTIEVGPRGSGHPGLHPMAASHISRALQVGMRLLRAPRIGLPSPTEPDEANFAVDADVSARQKRFSELSRQLESRGFGIAAAKCVGHAINNRLGKPTDPWFGNLSQTTDTNERAAIVRAVAEWSDGDTIAAHYAYGNDVLCTEDLAGNSARKSVFDQETRNWLAANYGVEMCTVTQLAARLQK
jgi:hypothetical protein